MVKQKRGDNALQAQIARRNRAYDIINELGFIELPELYAKMGFEFGVTSRKVDEYLKILEGVKQIVSYKTELEGVTIKGFKTMSFINALKKINEDKLELKEVVPVEIKKD